MGNRALSAHSLHTPLKKITSYGQHPCIIFVTNQVQPVSPDVMARLISIISVRTVMCKKNNDVTVKL
jgi:hypothetical protein